MIDRLKEFFLKNKGHTFHVIIAIGAILAIPASIAGVYQACEKQDKPTNATQAATALRTTSTAVPTTIDPESPAYNMRLGDQYSEQGNHPAARSCYEKAAVEHLALQGEYGRDYAWAMCNIGRTYYRDEDGDLGKALSYLNRAAAIYLKDEEGKENAAIVQGSIEMAYVTWGDRWFAQGKQFYKEKSYKDSIPHFEKAAEAYERAVDKRKHEHGDVFAHIGLAYYLGEDDYKSAIMYYEKALSKFDDESIRRWMKMEMVDAYTDWAFIYWLDGDTDSAVLKALAAYRIAKEISYDTKTHLDELREYYNFGGYNVSFDAWLKE